MAILTCAICGLPLSPVNAYRCSKCGKIVCRQHIVYTKDGRKICTRCAEEAAKRKERIREPENVALVIPTIEY